MTRIVAVFFALTFYFGSIHLVRSQDLGWVPTQGPYSTQVNAFGVQGIVFYAGTNTGLYSSTNSGDTWTKNYYITGIVRDIESNGQNIYVGGSGGVSISTDAGVTWIVRDTGLPQFSLVYEIRNVNDTLFACLGGDGLYRSVDSGKHWTQPYQDIATRVAVAMINTGTSFIIAEGAGILRSANYGFSWDEPTGLVANQSIHTFLLKGTTIFAGTDAGVYESTDDGLTWLVAGSGISGSDVITSLALSGDGKTILAGAANATGGGGVYRSQDNGVTWTRANSGLQDQSIYGLFAASGDDRVFAGTAIGASYSTNKGDSWHVASLGFPELPVNSLTTNYNAVFAGTMGSYVFSSVDVGQVWSRSSTGLTRANINAIAGVNYILYAGTDAVPGHGTGGLHRSTDNGATWLQLKDGIPIMNVSHIIKIDSGVLVAGDSGIYSSMDVGSSWRKYSELNATSVYYDDTLLYVASKSHTGLWVYGKNFGWVPFDGGETADIHAMTGRNGIIYVGTDSGVYTAIWKGVNPWKRVTNDTIKVRSLWQNDHLIVAGTTTGMFVSADSGRTWTFQASAGSVQINSIVGNSKNIYAATPSGVIEASLANYSAPSPERISSNILRVTNPSNDHTYLHYLISRPGEVSIRAYDLLGHQAIRVFEGHRDSGEYDAEWNSSAIPEGTYLIRLMTNGTETISKLTIIHR